MVSYELVSLESAPSGHDDILTVRRVEEPGWLGRLLGARPAEAETRYIGSGTVWWTFPGFRRCGSATEAELSELWELGRYGRAGMRKG